MSRDRVSFEIGEGYFCSRSRQNKMSEVLERAFGISESEIDCQIRTNGCVQIVCRPSQFARFLIWRNDAGINNGFKDLQAKLFTPKKPKGPIDVSSRTTPKGTPCD